MACGCCGGSHGVYVSCAIPKAPHYAWGYEWLRPRTTGGDPISDEICWVVPVADAEEASVVIHFFFASGLKCAGGNQQSPFRPGRDKLRPKSGYCWRIFYRWAPELREEAWKHVREDHPITEG